MARKQNSTAADRAPQKDGERKEDAARKARFRTVWSGLVWATLFSVAVVGLLFAWQELQRFLLRDAQFLVAAPPDLGEESPALEIRGLKNAARAQVTAVFRSDYGRSLYMLPIRERRLQLLGNPWIAEASVTRVWPNQIRVEVKEREPVAWVQIPGPEQVGEPALIDGDGNILRLQQPGEFQLPVLRGVGLEQNEEERKLRVHRFAKLLHEAGPLAEKISEVDASDPGNLKVMQDESGRVVMLYIGDRQFRRRLEKFRLSYPEIQKRAPESNVFDLRIEGNILSVPQDGGKAERIMSPEGPNGA
jgi:cell division protein FtsQ